MVLSIESSCDDSSLALTCLLSSQLLWHAKISQESAHSPYGGVVPELASRLHATNLPILLEKAKSFLNQKGHSFSDLKAIGVSTCPGLSITLLEGLMMAKTLALGLQIPLISVDHLKGHLYSLFINNPKAQFPLSALLVSGGHTLLLECNSHTDITIIAKSLDDSLGESFDKVSKMLGLGYPGGPIVENLAQSCLNSDALDFPLPLKHNNNLAFSFSGLKNAVRLAILEQKEQGELSEVFQARVCAGFQKIACAHLLRVLRNYFSKKEIVHFGLVGGVSANLFIRQAIEKLCQEFQIQLWLAPLEFCSDNAAMIGRCCVQSFKYQEFAPLQTLDICPHTSLPYVGQT
ncbi:tRNA (adenosine(37)-N6)-threonylcarbamoyltransferase complex transferase subunit TsaD [Helicobacter suis]|uniref:tRNA (adenosine(37)-N6)-threonylcarbamoyltransferase complex transferase subunit TsaD n=1 Tax=Helicobacter suis TaxID=104628 RepID=UPI0013CF85F2|nr:tRNA (adenosine(37)-N6)-threonylcarbamoyltransferase complex transferase subunit TsaD [Helicobacter suis]